MGLPTGSLQSTVSAYNAAAERGEDPLLHKKSEWVKPIGTPVGAIDLRASCAGFTLAGC
jgi:3-oxo-5alpha-steroid 4-dehydrogenase